MKNPASKLVRIRLELEEYEFDIIHIPGKENILADALSRIPFSNIKQLTETRHQVLAITRSMTKKKENVVSENKQEIGISKPVNGVLYNCYGGYTPKVPRIRTILDGNELRIIAFKSHKHLFEVRMIANEKLNFESVFSKLEMAAIDNNVEEIQWPIDDEIFRHIGREQFTDICLKTLKNLRIALVKPPRTIIDRNEINKIVEKYHNDEAQGGHCGRARLYATSEAHVEKCQTCSATIGHYTNK